MVQGAKRERVTVALAALLVLAGGAAVLCGRLSTGRIVVVVSILLAAGAVYGYAERAGWLDAIAEASPPSSRRVGCKAAAVLAALLVLAVAYVACTGGLLSPFFCLLYLPLLLLTLRYGALQGLAASMVLAAAYLVAAHRSNVERAEWLEAVSLTFPLAALFGSIFGAMLSAGLREIRARDAELRGLLDISRMLETALDIRMTLNLILLNTQRLVPCDTCAIYLLREDGALELADAAGAQVSGRALPEFPPGWARTRTDEIGEVIDLQGAGLESSPASAGSLAAAIRGTDGFIGLLFVGRQAPGRPFGDQERALLERLASHIALPLQQALHRDRLEWLAFNDPMTGLANYRYFQRRLEDELLRYRRHGREISLLILDIDYFKSFNDTWGHQAGDELLGRLGRILRETVRQDDLAARYGGEEFVVLCPETGAEEAALIGERIRHAVETASITGAEEGAEDLARPASRVTVSLGHATFPQNAGSGEELVLAADRALYTAKAAGRNCVRSAPVETLMQAVP